jgi:hypothetical protein
VGGLDDTEVRPLYRGEVRFRSGLARGAWTRPRFAPYLGAKFGLVLGSVRGVDGQGRCAWRSAGSRAGGRARANGEREELGWAAGAPRGAAARAGPPRRPDPPSLVAAVRAARGPPRSARRSPRPDGPEVAPHPPGETKVLPLSAVAAPPGRGCGGGPIGPCLARLGGPVAAPQPPRPRFAPNHRARPRFARRIYPTGDDARATCHRALAARPSSRGPAPAPAGRPHGRRPRAPAAGRPGTGPACGAPGAAGAKRRPDRRRRRRGPHPRPLPCGRMAVPRHAPPGGTRRLPVAARPDRPTRTATSRRRLGQEGWRRTPPSAPWRWWSGP